MKDYGKFVVGIGIGATACYVYTLIPSITNPIENSPLGFIEHYHVGLASILAGKHILKYKPYLQGAGITFIASDALDSTPFGINNPSQFGLPNIALGAGLLWLILV